MPQTVAPDTLRRVRRVQALTVTWTSIEAAVCLIAAWRTRSSALLAFGGDSAIELASAVVVLRRFYALTSQEKAERQAARIAGVLLFALAACVIATSVVSMLGYSEATRSLLGIGILAAASVLMPFLAREKRQLSAQTGSAALRADAAQSALCSYFSAIALLGLVTNAVWHIRWADPAAALIIAPLILREGWEAIQGKPCVCG